ncbi:MAG: mannose-1-phosphate guanylyltransferase [Candidatus Eiseniibacteriota bacterium]
MSTVHAVILAGGRGTRFWPASREALPKQFLAVGGGDSLLTRTGRRIFPLTGTSHAWVVTGAAHVARVAEHLPELSAERIVGEPVGRNTAPAVGLAAALVLREDPEGVLLVAPADAWIPDEVAFREAASAACAFASERGGLVTFGIAPASPATGYGYVEAGKAVAGGVRRAVRFTEKPDAATAARFLAAGRHFWNAGIFAWRADVFLEELARQRPAMADACRRMAAAKDLGRALAAEYPALESISVDYGLLEAAADVYVLPVTFAWSDVGSWDVLPALLSPDGRGNVLLGDVLALDAARCLVRSEQRFTALVGVEDLLVVDTADALLICPKARAQDVKQVVEHLEKSGRRDLL